MSEPMTAAEQAAAEVLCRIHNRRVDIAMELEPDDFVDEAREMTAALRAPIGREVLREEAAAVKAGINGGPDLLVVPAHLWLEDRAALRTTTPEDPR